MPVIYKGNRRINVPEDAKPHWEEAVKQPPVPQEDEPQEDTVEKEDE